MKMPLAISFALVGLIFTVFFGIITFFLWREYSATSQWPTTKGLITVSEKERTFQDSANHRNYLVWRPVVHYKYTVNGTEYVGTRISGRIYQEPIRRKVGVDAYQDPPPSGKFMEILKRYAVGNEVSVYYNPVNPEDSLLEIDKIGIILFGGIALGGITVSVISLVWYFIKK